RVRCWRVARVVLAAVMIVRRARRLPASNVPLSIMRRILNRREFVTFTALSPAMAALSCRHPGLRGNSASAPPRLFFTSQGRTALMNADGTGLRYFNFNVPNQETWQPGLFLSDGRRVIFLSMESRRDGPGRPFEEY